MARPAGCQREPPGRDTGPVPGDPPVPRPPAWRRWRQADYAVPVPGSAGCRLAFAFSALGAGDPRGRSAGILAGLLDVIMSAFKRTRLDDHEKLRSRPR